MSLRWRLALLLGLVVAATLLVAWVLTRRAVLAPFTREVVQAHLDQTVFIATELEGGADAEALARKLGVEIDRRRRRPRFARPRRGPHGRKACEVRVHRAREVFLCRGPRTPVATELATGGWVVVRRDLDVQAPRQRIGVVLLVLAGVIVGLSFLVAIRITRPLEATLGAMRRMAEGDLSHRLPEAGGPELAAVGRTFNSMANRIDQMLRAEKEMMAGISHELRTPLARMRLELELLRDAGAPAKRLDAMDEDVEEVDHLIAELLELSRLSLGDRDFGATQVNLRDIVDEAVRRFPLPDHTVEVAGDGAPARGDRARLVRVVRNLLQNAGKYAPRGTTVRLTVDGLRLTVEDEGPGVPAGDLERLFEPFYRGQAAASGSATGHGVGLMYARQVVELSGGRIWAENRTDGGLRIRAELVR